MIIEIETSAKSIRADVPGLQIVGPSHVYGPSISNSWWSNWAQFIKNNASVPDHYCWHFETGSGDMETWNSTLGIILDTYGLPRKPILFSEVRKSFPVYHSALANLDSFTYKYKATTKYFPSMQHKPNKIPPGLRGLYLNSSVMTPLDCVGIGSAAPHYTIIWQALSASPTLALPRIAPRKLAIGPPLSSKCTSIMPKT